MPGQSEARIFELAKGFRNRAKNCIKIARNRVEKAMQHSYRTRHLKSRDYRSLWMQKINAGSRELGMNYSTFWHSCAEENIYLNRKMLAELVENEPHSFRVVLETAKQHHLTNVAPMQRNMDLLRHVAPQPNTPHQSMTTTTSTANPIDPVLQAAHVMSNLTVNTREKSKHPWKSGQRKRGLSKHY